MTEPVKRQKMGRPTKYGETMVRTRQPKSIVVLIEELMQIMPVNDIVKALILLKAQAEIERIEKTE